MPPAELETLLLTHPGVADVCVVGVPDENAGELPRAYCVKKQGAENTTADDVINFVTGECNWDATGKTGLKGRPEMSTFIKEGGG